MPHGSCLTSHSHHYNLAEHSAIRPSLNPLVVHYREHLSTKTQMCAHQILWPFLLESQRWVAGRKPQIDHPTMMYMLHVPRCVSQAYAKIKKKRGSFSLLLYRRLQTLRLDWVVCFYMGLLHFTYLDRAIHHLPKLFPTLRICLTHRNDVRFEKAIRNASGHLVTPSTFVACNTSSSHFTEEAVQWSWSLLKKSYLL